MSLAIVYSRALLGIQAPPVTVEVHLANGLPALSIVGLPETTVKESKDRVRSAILNSRFDFPARRITVNLAPADLPKDGGRFDLPIAIGILVASGQLSTQHLSEQEFLGELALNGELRPVRGTLTAALRCAEANRSLVVPGDNADEAARVGRARVLAGGHLLDVCAHLAGETRLSPCQPPRDDDPDDVAADLADVRGQHQARRALEIAAAGGHNLLMVGPPGSGKTMLASRLPGILPPMDETEATETAAIYSTSQSGFDPARWRRRPFRSPHHTASGVALVGGGSHPRPGEISLAHNGILFLDELPEFDRRVLEVLREPLESGFITVSRAARQADFPARFQLVAAMNPCPCGYAGDPSGRCRCTPDQILRYRGRISGPLLDRIDMHVPVRALPREQLLDPDRGPGESSAAVRARVVAGRARQRQREGNLNSMLTVEQIDRYCRLDPAGRKVLEQAMERLGMSARSYHRLLRLARTVADLAGVDDIAAAHVSEAVGLRYLDRTPRDRSPLKTMG
jgi:magnesium chelatase family protein